MIKLIASDMDGTFLNREGQLPEGSIPFIHKLNEKNILFVVATGRQTKTIENDFEEVVSEIGIIAENGSVVKYKGETIGVTTLDQEIVREVIRELREIQDAIVVLCTEHKAYVEAPEELIEDEIKKYYHSRAYVKDLLEVEEAPIKIAVYHEDSVEKITEIMRPRWEDKFKMAVSGRHWVDFGDLNVNKGKAIQMLQEKLGIQKEECMAFGDYFNDVELLDSVEESYAMEKAPEGVKSHAKYVIPTGSVRETVMKVIGDC